MPRQHPQRGWRDVADVLVAGGEDGRVAWVVGACAGGAVCVHWMPLGFSQLLLSLELGTSGFSKVLCVRDGRVRDKTASFWVRIFSHGFYVSFQ